MTRALAALLLMLAALVEPVRGQTSAVESRELILPGVEPGGSETVWVGWPRGASGPLPVVVALHGAGEARLGRGRGHWGWPRDYELEEAFAALLAAPLSAAAYRGLVDEAHLAARNRALAARAFGGLVVVAPYTPNLLAESVGAGSILAFGDWVAGPLLDAVRREVPVASPEAAGIDGVSLGGRMALEVGLRHPERFQSVGAIQPAVRGRVSAIAALARPGQALRLLSSRRDPFLPATRALSEAWTSASLPHELLVVPGPHDYIFNRGPGSIELLYFHDAALGR
jgi:pimeloyl-ACP methyl ester carboxylesterase